LILEQNWLRLKQGNFDTSLVMYRLDYSLTPFVILWFAGASAMARLLNLIPRYLPRFGMVPRWVAFRRPLVVALFVACVVITVVFQADVEAQGSAYATGVLVLMLSAGVAVALALKREAAAAGQRSWKKITASWYFWLVSAIFGYTLVDNVIERSNGVLIASVFILAVVLIGAASRSVRSMEMRVSGLRVKEPECAELWKLLLHKKVHLVPLRTNSSKARRRKARELKRYITNPAPLAFIRVKLLDNRSEFLSPVTIGIAREGDDFVLEVDGAVAIANTIAYVSELIDPITLFLGLTRQNLTLQALRYMFLGEGEVGVMVYKILVRYWEWTPEEDVRPNIVLVSESPITMNSGRLEVRVRTDTRVLLLFHFCSVKKSILAGAW